MLTEISLAVKSMEPMNRVFEDGWKQRAEMELLGPLIASVLHQLLIVSKYPK